MNGLNDSEIKKHPYVTGANKLTELCKDLFTKTPINFFEPYKIYKNNDYCGLMTDGIWSEMFLKKGYQHSGIAKFQESYLKSDFTLWSVSGMYQINDCAKQMRQDCIDFNYGNGITLIERHADYTQLYYFAAGSKHEHMNEILINHLDLLNHFVLHFEEKCRQDKVLLASYNQKYPCINEVHTEHAFTKFEYFPAFDRVYFHDLNKDFYLTQAEFKCLKWIVLGLSSKQAAKELKLSPRTVERHLQNAKMKAGCASIDALIHKTSYKIVNQKV